MKYLLSSACIFFAIFYASTVALAEQQHGWPSITLSAGGYSMDGSGTTDGTLYGAKLGYEIKGSDFSRRLGVEVVYNQFSATFKGADEDVDVSILRLDALYLFDAQEKVKNITPFLTVGAGGRFLDKESGSETDPLVCYGAGIKFPLTAAIALRAEARHLWVFTDEQKNDFEYVLGVQYTFGKKVEKVKKPDIQFDSDGDGIIDTQDQCPETPVDMKVNRQGCMSNPPDTDGDGVPDHLDRCPQTEQGYSVDKTGCLSDSDRDGVPDIYDKCPNNPPGFEVNTDGCMKISD